MTKEEISQAQATIERGREVIATLEKLELADPYKSGRRISFTEVNTGTEVVGNELLRKMLAAGRLKLIRDFESELSGLNLHLGPAPVVAIAE